MWVVMMTFKNAKVCVLFGPVLVWPCVTFPGPRDPSAGPLFSVKGPALFGTRRPGAAALSKGGQHQETHAYKTHTTHRHKDANTVFSKPVLLWDPTIK